MATVYFVPFDIEIIRAGTPSGRYINRGTDTSSGYAYINENPIYCLPEFSYRFDIDPGINAANIKSDQLAEGDVTNFEYKFSKQYILWDFGDGETSHEYRPTHTYDTPGSYRITVTLYDHDGLPRRNPYTYTLNIENYYPDQIKWHTDIYSVDGMSRIGSSIPLSMTIKRTNSWQDMDMYKTISVYASGSNSLPGLEEQYMSNKYAHFQPTWKFLPSLSDPVPVDKITTSSKPIRAKINLVTSVPTPNDTYTSPPVTYFELIETDAIEHESSTTIIGTAGESQLYYVDDQAKNYIPNITPPVFLFATNPREDLSISSSVPRDAYDVYPVEVTYARGNELMVTTNGIPTFKLQETKYCNSINSLSISTVSSPVTGRMVESEKFGSSTIEVTNFPDFLIGDTIVLSPGTTREESNKVIGYGNGPTGMDNSIVLSKPLTNNHPEGSTLSTVSIGGIIVKSDYPELRLTEKSRTDPLKPFEVRVYIDDTIPYSANDLILSTRTLDIETPGSCNLTFTPTVSTTENASLVVEVCIQDPFYVPANLPPPFMCLTNSNRPEAYIIKSAESITGGTVYQTNVDGTFSGTPVQTIVDSAFTHKIELDSGSLYPTCVDPAREFIYIGDSVSDQIYKIDRLGNIIDTIFIPELICQSSVLSNRYSNLDNVESTLLDIFYGSSSNVSAPSFEETSDPCYNYNEMVTEDNAMSPSSIAVDRDGNLWVALIDGLMTVKISPIPGGGHEISAVALPDMMEMNIANLTERSSTGEFKIMPSKVDTDRDNNIYVLYTNHELQMVIKYNSIGNELSRLSLPLGSHLTDIMVAGSGEVYITDSTSVYSGANITDVSATGGYDVYTPCEFERETTLKGAIYKIDAPTGGEIRIASIISSYTAGDAEERLDKPTQLTCDIDSNIYVTSGSNNIIKIVPGTLETTLYHTCGNTYTSGDNYDSTIASGERQAIDALGCNLRNEIIVSQSANRYLDVYSLIDTVTYKYLDQPSHVSTQSYTDISSNIKMDSGKYGYDLVQANGDWTGLRWVLKYIKMSGNTRVLTSKQRIHVQKPSANEIVKVNEHFDATESLIGYTLQETINSNYRLLYGFFKSVVGDIDDFPETLGKTVYEKISNFTSNNKDIDTCNISALIALGESIDGDIMKYSYSYPGSVKRLLDIFSVNYSYLLSTRDMSSDHIDKSGYDNNFNYGRNLGPLLENVKEYIVNIDVPFVAKELYNEGMSIIHPMCIAGPESSPNYSTLFGGLSSYPLSEYDPSWNWGLSVPSGDNIFTYYDFYEYHANNTYTTSQFASAGGIIDWDSPMTTIPENSRDIREWEKPGGIMSSIIDKKLRYGLNLIR